MVKLRVTARVIPEDVYLASIESSTPDSTRTREEKRFYVVIREPESYYIGSLALEIKRKYESLYKHDLGQIKYLKANEDDCDLDPELFVVDVLVDEGKLLRDPSDQHVTIKVIQEQGRAVRQDSVVPDLSQTHYQLPERLARPPVPRFEDLAPQLGKRKAEEDMQRNSNERKRSRLDEIEGGGVVKSIERDPPADSDVVIQDSQPERSSPPPSSQQTGAVESPQFRWSFKSVGVPTIVERTSNNPTPSQEQAAERQATPAASNVQNKSVNSSSKRRRRQRTPVVLREELKTPRPNGVQSDRSTATNNSGAKKFLRPNRDTFAFPESDIDDSQTSPGLSRSLITSRPGSNNAVSDVRTDIHTQSRRDPSIANLERNHQIGEELQVVEPVQMQDDTMEDENMRSTPSSEENAVNRARGSNHHSLKSSGTGEEQNQSRTEIESDRSGSHASSNQDISGNATGQENDNEETSTDRSSSTSDQSTEERATSTEDTRPSETRSLAEEQELVEADIDMTTRSLSETTPVANRTASPYSRVSKARSQDRANRDNDSASTASEMDLDRGSGRQTSRKSSTKATTKSDGFMAVASVGNDKQPDEMMVDTIRVHGASNETKNPSISALSTPALDSPGLQLSRALRESADKEPNDESISSENSEPSILADVMDTVPSKKKTRSGRRTESMNDLDGISGDGSNSFQNSASPKEASSNSKSTASNVNELSQKATSTVTRPSIEDSRPVDTQAGSLTVPNVAQAQREPSADSQVTNSSKVILPVGWTLERYEKFVKDNTNLKPAVNRRVDKRRGTPALSKATSTGSTATTTTAAAATAAAAPGKKKTQARKARRKSNIKSKAQTTAESAPEEEENEEDGAATELSAETNDEPATKDSSIRPSGQLQQQTKNQSVAPTENSVGVKNRSTEQPSASFSREASSASKSTSDERQQPAAADTDTTNVQSESGSRAVSRSIESPRQTKKTGVRLSPSNTTPKKMAQTNRQGSSNSAKQMPPPPPSSTVSTTTNTGRKPSATPTPAPRSKPSSASKFTTINTPAARKNVVKQPTPKPSHQTSIQNKQQQRPLLQRPPGPPTLSSARNLQELRAIVNSSANTSTRSSPLPSSSSRQRANRSRFTSKSSLMNHDDDDSSSSDDPSSSSSEEETSQTKKNQAKGNQNKTKIKNVNNKITRARPGVETVARSSQPDPTIRDDDDDDDDEDSGDGDSD